MSNKVVQKIISRGLQNIVTKRLNSDFTAYTGEAVEWQGETGLAFTPSQTTTELPSGNDPAWDVIKGAVVGDVELTLYEIPLSVMEEILSVKYDVTEGVCVGDSEDGTVFLGISSDRLISEGSVNSRNKLILYKVCFDLPVIDNKTVSKDDNAVADVKLKGKAYPVYFTKTGGGEGSRTYCIVNSVLNSAKYTANTGDIVFPGTVTASAS